MADSAARKIHARAQPLEPLDSERAQALELHGVARGDAVQAQDALRVDRAAQLADRLIQQRTDRVPVQHLTFVLEPRRAQIFGQLYRGVLAELAPEPFANPPSRKGMGALRLDRNLDLDGYSEPQRRRRSSSGTTTRRSTTRRSAPTTTAAPAPDTGGDTDPGGGNGNGNGNGGGSDGGGESPPSSGDFVEP